MNNKTIERIAEKWERIDQMEKSEIAPIPLLLMLEVTNACNLKCKMCANHKMTRPKGMMSKDLGIKVIQEAAQIGIREIALYTTGEPLLYPHLETLIVEAKKNNIYCYLTSNGLLLDQDKVNMLCRSGLDSFKFSIDGSNKEEYESIRRGGNFETLLNNVQLLRDTRDRNNSKLKIICAMVIIEENQNHPKEFKKLFEHIADDILISKAVNLGGKYMNNLFNERILNNELCPCRLLWDRIIINYDGKVTACCIDFDAELVYGDYKHNTLKTIWNNKLIRSWRKKHLLGKLETMPLCNACDAPYIFNTDNLDEKNLRPS